MNPTVAPSTRCPSTSMLESFSCSRQAQDLLPDRADLLEVPAVHVEAGKATKHGKDLRQRRAVADQGQSLGKRVLDLAGIALDRHQGPREAGPQRQFLDGALGSRRRRGEHLEQVGREPDRAAIPAASVVQEPEAVDHLVELVEVPLRHPARPGVLEVPLVGRHRGERGLASRSGELAPLALGEGGEPGRMALAGPRPGSRAARRAVRPRIP